MTETIQKGFTSELIETLQLVTIFTIKRIKLQHVLYFTAFLAFGIGDGVTGAYMMEKLGAGIESNIFARYFFMEHGFEGMVMAKVWITIFILFGTFIVQMKSPDSTYCINGFLIALTAGGLMAVNANLAALAGEMPQATGEIIFIYLSMLLMFTEIGSFLDSRTSSPENLTMWSGSYGN